MPFEFVKKSNRFIKPSSIEKAIIEIKSGQKTKDVCMKYKISKAAISRYIKGQTNIRRQRLYGSRYITCQIFTKAEEKALSTYVEDVRRFYYTMSGKTIQQLAYQYAFKNDIKIPNNWLQNKHASYDWLRAYLKRNPDVSLGKRKTKNLYPLRTMNRLHVKTFFNNLETILSSDIYSIDNIWNVGEIDLTSVHIPDEESVEDKNGNLGPVVTMCCGVNAAGGSIPSFYIFPSEYDNKEKVKSLLDCNCTFNTLGDVTPEAFVKYFEHFINYAKPTKANPHLVIYDNRSSHLSLELFNLARANGVILLTLPPHYSKQFQPLHINIFDTFKRHFNSIADSFMSDNKCNIMIYDLPQVVNKALPLSFTPENIKDAFRKSGIFPYRRECVMAKTDAADVPGNNLGFDEPHLVNVAKKQNDTKREILNYSTKDVPQIFGEYDSEVSDSFIYTETDDSSSENEDKLDPEDMLQSKILSGDYIIVVGDPTFNDGAAGDNNICSESI